MACAGLIWMQIALKEDLDALKEKLHSSKAYCHTHSYLVTDIKSSLPFVNINQFCPNCTVKYSFVFTTAVNNIVFITVESSQKVSSSEIPKLSEDLKNKERKLDDIENGDKGLSKLWSNLTEMNRKVSCFHLPRGFEATLTFTLSHTSQSNYLKCDQQIMVHTRYTFDTLHLRNPVKYIILYSDTKSRNYNN